MKNFKNISAKSTLENDYIKYLKNKNIEVVSFDIFETLAFRGTKKATDLFNSIAKHEFVKNIFFTEENFVLSRIEAEKLARKFNAKKEDVTLNLIYKQLPLTHKQRKKIIKIELKEEHKSLYINFQIKRWLKLAYKYNKKIILTSDTYFSYKELEKIVFSKLDIHNKISKVYISNEQNLTKATGNLYIKILEEFNINSSQLLHIGDNRHSDIDMAKQKNINTIHYFPSKYLKELFEIENGYTPSLNENHNYRVQASLLNPYKSDEEKFFFDLGAALFAPILWEFSHWIVKLAKSNNISQVNCVMREGRIFKKYISKLDNNLDINLIYASRKSTFLPAMDIETIETNGVDFSGYRDFDVKALRDIDKIKKDILKEKKLFKQYLKQLNYKKDSILIDFGGTGSILKNIDNILSLSKKEQSNVLFYMHSGGSSKMQGSKIFSFLPLNNRTNKNIELIRRNHEFIEILFNGNNSTTLHYQQGNNKVKAITAPSNKAQQYNRTKLDAFDKGIDAFFSLCKQYNLKSSLYLKENLLSILSRIIEVPTADEALKLGNLYHDENHKNIKKLITKKDIKTIKEIGIDKSFFKNSANIAFKAGEVSWVNGVITRIDNRYIKRIKSLATKGINSDSIAKILEVLDNNSSIKEIYLFGAGELFKELLPSLQIRNIKIKTLIDSRAKVSNFTMLGYKVFSLEQITFKDGECIVVSSVVFSEEITKSLIKHAKDKKIKIINFSNSLLEIN